MFVAVKFFSGLVRVHIKHKVSKNDQGEKMIPSGLQISWTITPYSFPGKKKFGLEYNVPWYSVSVSELKNVCTTTPNIENRVMI